MFTELSGTPLKEKIENTIAGKAAMLIEKGRAPRLAVVMAGNDSDQLYYEKAIVKTAEGCGVEVVLSALSADASTEDAVAVVKAVSSDAGIHGIIIMRPMPSQIDEDAVRAELAPEKDVDAITDISAAELLAGRDAFVACTAEACMEILKYYGIETAGKKVAIMGRSMTVGRPLAMLLMNADATVTVCHSKTAEADQIAVCRSADIVILATGRAEGYDSRYFRNGQIVIDVGTTAGEDGSLHGDLDVNEIKASGAITELSYTPVPGGVGKITTVLLLRNVLKAAEAYDRSTEAGGDTACSDSKGKTDIGLKLAAMPIEEFIEALKACTPTPGGGGVAALDGALGAALVMMVANYTIGKTKYSQYEAECIKARDEADAIRAELLKGIDADAEAYAHFKEDPVGAAEAPLNVMRLCVRVLELSRNLIGRSNPNLVSDLYVAALNCQTAMRAAQYNVEANLSAVKEADPEMAESMIAEMKDLAGKMLGV